MKIERVVKLLVTKIVVTDEKKFVHLPFQKWMHQRSQNHLHFFLKYNNDDANECDNYVANGN